MPGAQNSEEMRFETPVSITLNNQSYYGWKARRTILLPREMGYMEQSASSVFFPKNQLFSIPENPEENRPGHIHDT